MPALGPRPGGTAIVGGFALRVDQRHPRRGARYRLGARATRSDASWALYACASLHGLERWRREAAAECVLLSGHALTAAIRQGRWDVTLVHRGRHEAALAAIGQPALLDDRAATRSNLLEPKRCP